MGEVFWGVGGHDFNLADVTSNLNQTEIKLYQFLSAQLIVYYVKYEMWL
jgi:hypothetical protein